MIRSLDEVVRRFGYRIAFVMISAIGLWKWLVEGDINGLIGIGTFLLAVLAMELIKKRADRPYR